VRWILFIVAAACGETPAPVEREPAAQSGYDIHEWGLLGYQARSERATVMAASSPSLETIGLGGGGGYGVGYAPVIYAHLDGIEEQRFEAAVSIPESAVIETWPLSPNARWQVRAHTAATCRTSYPTRSDPPCDTVRDNFCEAMQAALYEASDGACLEVGDRTYDHLLYRAEVRRDALPFDVVREGDRFVVRAAANAPAAQLLYVRRSFTLRTAEVVTFAAPAAGQSMPLPEPGRTTDAAATVRDLWTELTRAGLTEPEATAFRAAWLDAIVPEERSPRFPAQARIRLSADVRPAADAVYYWLPRESADAILPLSFTPAPRSVSRALLVRISLDEERERAGDARSARIQSARGNGISGDVVRRVVTRYFGEIRFCATQIGIAPGTRLSLHADLLATGSIEHYSETVRTEPENELFAECAVDALRRWAFPPPTDGHASIDVDIVTTD
jgi:hypothetical protein